MQEADKKYLDSLVRTQLIKKILIAVILIVVFFSYYYRQEQRKYTQLKGTLVQCTYAAKRFSDAYMCEVELDAGGEITAGSGFAPTKGSHVVITEMKEGSITTYKLYEYMQN